MRALELTAIDAVEKQFKRQLEPLVASQQMVQSIIDAQQPMIDVAVQALVNFAEAAEMARNMILPRLELVDAFGKMQKLTEITKVSFELPTLPTILPLEFGEMCVEVMEDEKETIPAFVPDRRITKEDRRLIAMEVVQALREEELVIATKKIKPKLLAAGTTIQKIVIVRLNNRSRFKIVINDNYQNPIAVGRTKCWEHLLRVAERELFCLNQIKSTFDYLNTNNRCVIYKKTSYSLTNILHVEENNVVASIPLEVISEKAFKTRYNKIT